MYLVRTIAEASRLVRKLAYTNIRTLQYQVQVPEYPGIQYYSFEQVDDDATGKEKRDKRQEQVCSRIAIIRGTVGGYVGITVPGRGVV